MASIEIRNVSKSFGSVSVLNGIDLTISDREFVVLVGPSGCGKSTLLRMIAGLESITGGDIMIAGERINDQSPRERDLAMVFQSYALYPHMTTSENMGFSLKLKRRPQEEQDERVGAAAATLHLEQLLNRLPKQLSGGQRQRVAMGRAIVRNPRAFLFDEPLSNLDAKLRTHMRAEIRQLHQSLEATSVYVTHDQIEAMTMADRIVVMNKGRIEQIGTPIELFDEPANLFVAGFLGAPTMNLFDATLADPDGGPSALIGSGAAELPVPSSLVGQSGRQVTVGIRPQHLRVDEASGAGALAARVQVVEQTGCETNLHVMVNGEECTVQTKERANVHVGDMVTLSVAAEQVHVFDRAAGMRLG